jgi:hypothetical protein
MDKDTLLSEIRRNFKVGDDSYNNQIRNITALLRLNGEVGLAASAEIVSSYSREVEQTVQAMGEPPALPSAKRSWLNILLGRSPEDPGDGWPDPSYHRLFTIHSYLAHEINPYNFPCGWNPVTHLASACVIIREGSTSPTSWQAIDSGQLLRQLFLLLDFWIAYLRANQDAHAPQESLVMELMRACAAVHRLTLGSELPAFLQKIISESESLPTYTTDLKVTKKAMEAATGKITEYVSPSKYRKGSLDVSALARELFK